MYEAFIVTLNQMLQIILFLALGFIMNKTHLISREAEGVLSRLVTLLFLPCLTLYSNMMECKLSSLSTYLSWTLYGLLFYVVSMLLSYPLSSLFSKNDAYQRGIYRYAFSFPNSGAVGTPMVQSLFGTMGLFQFGLYTFFGTFFTYSWGVAQLQPSHGKTSFARNLMKCLNANFIAMLIGMALGLLGAPNWIPTFIPDAIFSLSKCYVPVALLMTGFSIADYPIGKVFHNLKIYLYSIYRLLVLPAVFLLLLYVIKAPLMVATMTVLAFAGPCGMNVVVYPASYGEDCSVGASIVLVSSIGSIVTVPVIYAITQVLFH